MVYRKDYNPLPLASVTPNKFESVNFIILIRETCKITEESLKIPSLDTKGRLLKSAIGIVYDNLIYIK